jgi:hypothetical protein
MKTKKRGLGQICQDTGKGHNRNTKKGFQNIYTATTSRKRQTQIWPNNKNGMERILLKTLEWAGQQRGRRKRKGEEQWSDGWQWRHDNNRRVKQST